MDCGTLEKRGWLKHVRQEQSTFFILCVSQQQMGKARAMKLLQPRALGSVAELLVCHSDDPVTPAELQTLEEMVQASRAEMRK